VGRLITIGDIASKLGVSTRQRADQISRQKTFPDPVQVAGRYRLWDEGQIDAWLDQHRPGWRGETQDES
jgi:predicted DNA-binding transcriptional regulator AlpA